MENDSNLMQKIILSKRGQRVHSKSKFKDYYDPKTHTCSGSDITHQIQMTDVYRNTHFDYFYLARDMVWNHPFWTKMRADILADAASRLPYIWKIIEIQSDFENQVTSLLGRGAKYIIIRNQTITGVKSSVLIAGSLPVEEAIDVYSTIESTLVFAPYIEGKTVERLKFSRAIQRELKLARTKALVEMALNSVSHILCEGIPDDTDFLHRLNFYLQADNMLINGNSPLEKTKLVDKTGLVKGNDMVDLAKLLSSTPVILPGWKLEFSYLGLPEFQANSLKDAPSYTLDEHRLWAKATLIGETQVWYLESGIPNEEKDGEEECPKLTWLTNQKKNMTC